MTRKTTYLAGPMRGHAQYNFPAFHRATEYLRDSGWSVWSPAEHDLACGFDPNGTLDGFDFVAAFTWDIQHILLSDAIHLLPGWQMSSGAITELVAAVTFGKSVYVMLGTEGALQTRKVSAYELAFILPGCVKELLMRRYLEERNQHENN